MVEFKVGDRVRFNSRWLRTHHRYFGDEGPDMVGTVVSMGPIDKAMQVTWDGHDGGALATWTVLKSNMEVTG